MRTNLLTRNAYLAMWGSNLLDPAPYVAHAMQSLLDVKRHALAIALSFLATGIVALDACNFSFGNWDTPWGCPDAGPAPPNSTTTTSDAGCSRWSCNPGFYPCGSSDPCAVNLLGDPHNCGACGNDCGGGSCSEGTCAAVRVLGDGLDTNTPVATDVGHVYAFDANRGSVMSIPKNGMDATKVADTACPDPGGVYSAIATDASGVYWLCGGAIQVAQAGGTTRTLASGLMFAQGPLLLDASAVYFVSMGPPDGVDGGFFDPAVWRVSKTGGAPAAIFPLSVLEIGAVEAPLVMTPGRLAFTDGTKLLLGSTDGGVETLLYDNPLGYASIAADDASIYFTRGGLVSSYGDQCVPLDAGCPLPEDPDSAASGQGAFAISWEGGTPRLVAPTYSLSLLRSGHGALWGLTAEAPTSPAPIIRVDVKTGLPTAFAGGGLIASFAVDAAGIYWVRDGKLLFSAQK